MDLLRTMWAAVRSGGTLAAEDADFGGLFCYPPNDAFEFYARGYRRVLQLHAGDPAAGRKLFRYFREAGIPTPQLKLVQRVDAAGESKTLAHSTLEATAEAIIAGRIASPQQVNDALAALARFTADPHTIIGDPRVFQLWSKR